jgi:hypothetical protein
MAKRQNTPSRVQTNAGVNPMGAPASKNNNGVKAALRGLAPGGITRKEFQQAAKQTGASSQQLVQKMDIMNKAGQDVRLNSGAANMLIKQAQKATPKSLGYQPVDFGTGNIGRALQGMLGTRATGGYQNPQSGYGEVTPAVAPSLMIGGTQIRPGGRVAVRPMGAAPAVGDTAADTTAATDGTTSAAGDGTMAGDQYDFQSMLDALTAMQQPQFDMAELTDMFTQEFEKLSAQFDSMDPLQLAQLGRAYGGDAIRARQRMRKTSRDYRRNLPSMALGQSLANLASMGIGGGVTL